MASYYGSSGFRKKSKVGFILILGLLGGVVLQSGCAGLAGTTSGGGSGSQTLSVSSPSTSSVTQSSVMVAWQTNLPATSQIEYGTSSSYGSTTALDSSLVTNHQQGMSGLKSATLYHFRVHSRDANSNEAVSADMTVTTASAPDTTAPTVSISSPAANATLSGTVSVTATASDNVGVVGVQFKVDGNSFGAEATSSPYSASLNTTTLSNGNHTLTAAARDAAGNTSTSAGVIVNVSNTTPDTTPPTISGVNASGITSSGATIIWTTNEASDSQVDYGTTTAYGLSTPLSTALVTSHSVALSGLTASTLYHYRVKSRDAAGNLATSGDFSFATSAPGDTTPPTVSITAPAGGSTVSGTVAVSASASDNVGVVGVQFLLDGANLGAEVTVAPYSVSWDTTTATNAAHTLTARARDAAGNQTTSVAVSVTVTNAVVAELTFAQRSVGATVAQNFTFGGGPCPVATHQSSFAGCIQGSDTGIVTPLKNCDPTLNPDNGCAVEFIFRGLTSASGAGVFGQPGWSIDPGGIVYFSYKYRRDSTAATFNWTTVGSTPKEHIVYQQGKPSCTSQGWVQTGQDVTGPPYKDAPEGYTACGQINFYLDLNGNLVNTNPHRIQQNSLLPDGLSYECSTASVPKYTESTCLYYQADIWQTFYYKFHYGTPGVNDSSVEAWEADPGQPMRKWLHIMNVTISQVETTPTINVIDLLPYMTNKNSTLNHPTAHFYYKDLIISNAPIPPPTGTQPAT